MKYWMTMVTCFCALVAWMLVEHSIKLSELRGKTQTETFTREGIYVADKYKTTFYPKGSIMITAAGDYGIYLYKDGKILYIPMIAYSFPRFLR